ncbi:cation-translocating P-type ATPase [Natronobacterium gregoryi]|uniref:Haloacid dehalogenase n=2 Tax=Natronobacterium gregoryi TaxID=44930 RepID=L0AE30_NATGS|nr:cation-transporting P-type ATPase [Natronobacterium gregoryi]AFZ71679.1 P-type ATPase, translocating [Natronobacterium gregoryi SP2]ELY72749.1 P-type HAD superfamily ATPase [Natronobacterium gregoryi SP2]PLK20273.1 haloacid dehalogenase [Natronobacterium gregoryi SP2]SFJ24869.1 Ca2+-transporting ATPase [Natronobacterium gregoryi]
MSQQKYDERTEPERDSNWHAQLPEDVYEELDTSEQGLDSEEARERLERHGPNEVETEEGASPLRIFLEQYTSVLIWVLIVAAGVMAAIGETLDAAVIAGIVVFITLFGFAQDYRAEQSIQALKELSTTYAMVSRDGEKTEVDATRVVPGDVVFVESGDAVPADARVIESANLRVDEAALTGESVSVSKAPETIEDDASIAERTNVLHKDTVVERGSGTAVVVETGSETEIGRIATALEEAEERDTPFQAELDRLGKIIAAAVIGVVTVIGITELVIGDTEPVQVFMTAVAVAVSAVPEGLPAVVTLSLALGARRMVEQNALVRRLPIVEALGSVDVICTDKTGTLTEEEMTVTRIAANRETYDVAGTGYDTDGEFRRGDETVDPGRIDELLRCGMLCNDVELGRREDRGEAVEGDEGDGFEDDERVYLGDPTEISLFVAARKAGFDHEDLRERYPRIDEVEFTSDRKRMTTLHETPGGDRVAYTKGAPEVVLERCTREYVDGEIVELTDERRAEIEARNEAFAEDALRVMAFAVRPDAPAEVSEDDEQDLVYLGLQGMLDPPRSEVTGALEGCLDAGIDVVMITGDNATTARAVGTEIGLESARVVKGPELEEMSDEELAAVVEDVDVFARTSPDHKTRILKTLQRKGHTVAMTGDGVNDAPAVKNADVGVAMGVRGTDVTEQASDIVLLDDNFATIRDAVRQGRRIFDNVRKFVNYFLSANGAHVLLLFTGIMSGAGLVMTPIMFLWINVVTDGIPALTLGVDPEADDVMERPPRPPDEGVITERIVSSIGGIAVLITATLLPLFYYYNQVVGDLVLAQTMVFTAFVFMAIARIGAIRSRYGLGLFSNNRWLVVAIAITLTLQLLVLYTPLSILFGVTALEFGHWLQIAVVVAAFSILMAVFVAVQNRYFDRY